MVVRLMYYNCMVLQKGDAVSIEGAKFQVVLARDDKGILRPIVVRAGLPLLLPNLWADEISIGGSFNTVRSYLFDLILAYSWADQAGVDLYTRLSSCVGLTKAETRSLARHMCTAKSGKVAAKATCARRLNSIRSFFRFALDMYLDLHLSDSQLQRDGDRIKKRLDSRLSREFSARQNLGKGTRLSTVLTSAQVQLIADVMHPRSVSNPFTRAHVRIRNYCILMLAYETWARRGELALLELGDLDLGASPTVLLKAPSSYAAYTRRDGASQKTSARVVPISQELAELLEDYREDTRDQFLRPRVPCRALFVSARDGRRLSLSAINEIFDAVREVETVKSAVMRVHPHGLRATGATEFRKGAKAKGAKDIELRDSVAYVGGWAQNSPMVSRYTRDAIVDQVRALRATKNG